MVCLKKIKFGYKLNYEIDCFLNIFIKDLKKIILKSLRIVFF